MLRCASTSSLADMRRYYDDMIADMRCLEARGELHEFFGAAGKAAVNKPPAPHSPALFFICWE